MTPCIHLPIFHYNLPFSTAICGNLWQSTAVCHNISAIYPQYVCNMSAISIISATSAKPTPLISTAEITLHRHPNLSVHSTMPVLCLFTKQPSQRYKPFPLVSYLLSLRNVL